MLISKIYCCTCSNSLFLFTTQASGLNLAALFWDFARYGHYNALGDPAHKNRFFRFKSDAFRFSRQQTKSLKRVQGTKVIK
jgi:hypothetical protein